MGVGLILGKYIKRHVVHAGKGLRTLLGFRHHSKSSDLWRVNSVANSTNHRLVLEEFRKSFIVASGEIFFVLGAVLLPSFRIPDLYEVHVADDYALLG